MQCFENQEDPLQGVCVTFQNHEETLCVDLMFDNSTLQFQMLKVIELGLVWIISFFCIYAKCIFYLDMFAGLIQGHQIVWFSMTINVYVLTAFW